MEEVNKESYIADQEKKRVIEGKVRTMFADGVPKAHIGKTFNIPVYEVTKIVTGRTDDVEPLFYFKKYRKMAVRIYWPVTLKEKTIQQAAEENGIEPWLAEELMRIFEKRKNQQFGKE